jgi:very-short-patch-repair endonuclease
MSRTLTSVVRSRALRAKQTDAERLLWARLRNRQFVGVKFDVSILWDGSSFDFCCPEAGLIVELDGGQHSLQQDADAERPAYLNALGYKVVRFWNNQVFEELAGVLATIATALGVVDSKNCP